MRWGPRGTQQVCGRTRRLGRKSFTCSAAGALPDVDWLERVTGRETVEVLAVLRETVDLLLTERLIHRALERTGRTYYAQFPAPLELYAITRVLRPRHAVESGGSSGLSSAHILIALERNRRGRLHSIDLPQYQRAQQRTKGELSWSVPLGKDSGWAIPARLTAAHLAFEFETIRPKLRSGSIVVADNTGVNPEAVRTLARAFGTKAWHRGTSSLIGMRIP